MAPEQALQRAQRRGRYSVYDVIDGRAGQSALNGTDGIKRNAR